MASSILILQSHNSAKELIGNDRSLLLYARSKFLTIRFYNGLGIVNIASFQGRTFDHTTRVWVRSFGTVLGRF